MRRNPYDLMSVYKERKYSLERKVRENAGSEILGDYCKRHNSKISRKNLSNRRTSKRSIQKNTEKIMNIINKRKGGEMIDWLEMIEKNNDLKKFFSD